MTYIIIEYVSGKTVIYPMKTKKDYKSIMLNISVDLQHIEEIKIVDMPKKDLTGKQ
tara:strand:+ start:37 stop:204 length:168 start_codon:yes stop_codon:yes gene_type:complete